MLKGVSSSRTRGTEKCAGRGRAPLKKLHPFYTLKLKDVKTQKGRGKERKITGRCRNGLLILLKLSGSGEFNAQFTPCTGAANA